jgi:hypothetical protein
MNEWINQSITLSAAKRGWLGGEGHRKHGMYESFLSSKVMIIEQVLSKLKDW